MNLYEVRCAIDDALAAGDEAKVTELIILRDKMRAEEKAAEQKAAEEKAAAQKARKQERENKMTKISWTTLFNEEFDSWQSLLGDSARDFDIVDIEQDYEYEINDSIEEYDAEFCRYSKEFTLENDSEEIREAIKESIKDIDLQEIIENHDLTDGLLYEIELDENDVIDSGCEGEEAKITVTKNRKDYKIEVYRRGVGQHKYKLDETEHYDSREAADNAVERIISDIENSWWEGAQDFTPAEFRCELERMGLNAAWLSKHWKVSEAAIKSWYAGTKRMPLDRQKQVCELQEAFDDARDDFTLNNDLKPGFAHTVYVPRTDEQSPDEYPASWHRAVAKSIVGDTDGITIEYK